MTQSETPVADEVGMLYDRMAGFRSEQFGENHNLHFGYWDTPDDDSPLERAEEHFTEIMIEKIAVRSGGRVLDVGCGLGTPAIRLARATGAAVTGVTVSHEQVKHATALAAAEGLAGKASFQYGDAVALPFDADSFDAAWALESIIHMPDRVQVLREINRVVRPGGRVVLTDFFERAPIPDHKRAAVEKFYRSWIMGPRVLIDDYPGLVRAAGLRLVELVDISEQVMRRTLLGVSDRIAREKRRLDDEFGSELVEQLGVAELADVWELGYLLLVAERPGVGQ